MVEVMTRRGRSVTTMKNVFSSVLFAESVTRMVKVDVLVLVGVPEIKAVAPVEVSVKPSGKEPFTISHAWPCSIPPVAVMESK